MTFLNCLTEIYDFAGCVIITFDGRLTKFSDETSLALAFKTRPRGQTCSPILARRRDAWTLKLMARFVQRFQIDSEI